jgi:phosphonopyruvate decarboxylase
MDVDVVTMPKALGDAEALLRLDPQKHREPFAFIVEKGTIAAAEEPGERIPEHLDAPRIPTSILRVKAGQRPLRVDVFREYLALNPCQAVVASTGYMGRELYGLSDTPNHFYMVGSMGCAASIGLGAALMSGAPVTVFDGDGALLMKLGSLATIGRARPSRFLHVLLDNGVHESTGSQLTNAKDVNFAAIAAGCGYRHVWECDGIEAVRATLPEASRVSGAAFVHCKICPGTVKNLARPKINPRDVAARFREFLCAAKRLAA